MSSIGFVMIFVGIIILMIASLFYGKGTINFGEVIFIGPFPIVIGVGPNVKLMISIAIILAVLSVVMLLILRRQVIRVNA